MSDFLGDGPFPLGDVLGAQGWTADVLAKALPWRYQREEVQDLIDGTRPITPDVAADLEQVLGVPVGPTRGGH